MAPKAKTGRRSQHRASTSYSSTDIAVNTTPNARNDGLREARTLKRKERSEVRRAEGEKYKEAGNTHFRASEYHKAAEEYQAAIDRHGPRAVYLSNLAAAWLKLEEWDAAEDCARRALEQDPSFIKARYRRGLARKGSDQLVAASIDFITVLQQDPTSAEAKTAYKEIIQIMRTRGELDKLRGAADDKVQYARDVVPLAQQEDMELESLSDSSDCQHEGNGLPCRSYNHDGCASGAGCAFSHAPDFNSIRDELGRNVCLFYLIDSCKVGAMMCAYAHEMTYLRQGGWWDDPQKRLRYRNTIIPLQGRKNPVNLVLMLNVLQNTSIWNWPKLAALEEETRAQTVTLGTGQFIPLDHGSEPLESDDEELLRFESELAERYRNNGFTLDEVQELLKRGVDPQDERAHDILKTLLRSKCL